MADQHQVNSIIATAIWDCRKDHPEGGIDPEEAKQIAKCIVEALIDAGLQIVGLASSSHSNSGGYWPVARSDRRRR